MTTQNTQFEHNDVDTSVVEHPIDSETGATPPAPVEAAAQAESSSPDVPPTPVAQGDIATPEATTVAVDQQPQETPLTNLPAESVVTMQEGTDAPLQETYSGPASAETVPSGTKEEEIPPFTTFIEEFRLSESRYSPEEAFTPFTPVASDFTSAGEQVVTDNMLPPLDFGEQPTSNATIDTDDSGKTASVEGASSAAPTEQGGEAVTPQPMPTAPPVERPVSPLLRPASRLRIPRHGVARHREEPAAEVVVAPTSQPAPEVAPAEAPAESPRPARRYRFDRPAANNGTTASANALPTAAQPAAPQRHEEPKEKENNTRVAPTRTSNGHGSEPQLKQPAAEVQTPIQEPVTIESTPLTPAPAEHGRRRHSQERQREKEQTIAIPAPTPVIETAPPVLPTPTLQAVEQPQAEEIAPEDLPPLEYADLQKASTRRRRRHRSPSGSNVAAVAPVANVAIPPVIAKPASQPIIAETPIAPAPAARVPSILSTPQAPASVVSSQYNIVSGYTVSQMNQGNEQSGPFMGPEPSPARGSLLSRDVRTGRAEVQRAPAYPARSDNGTSTASINQLASVVAQTIQAQTDRMVAELRRASQAPTNVSVTLPPFPSTERVGVFVDVANLLYSARTLRIGVDFGKLLDFLRGNRRLVRAHAYCPTSPQAGDEQMFLQAVKGLGYRITTKNYKTFSSGAKKADLDLDLCMDVVRLVDGRAVDCVVLVSGDSDFMPMLDYCSEHGVRVEVAAFDEAMSQTLRQSCDLFINLSMLEEIRS